MILSGTAIGLIGVMALLLASGLLAYLDMKEKGKGNPEKARFLSRLALGLFLAAFAGGVGVTLVGGIRPREEGGGEGGREASIGNVNEAELKSLEEKVRSNSKDVTARERLGHLYLQGQDYENVFRMSHEALQLNPKSTESRAHMGMVFFAMQQPDQALQQFDQALQSDPKNLEALLFKGIVQFQAKDDLKGAKETWDRYMRIATPSDTGYERVKMFLQNIDDLLTSR